MTTTDELMPIAVEIRDHLLLLPDHFDFGTEDEPTPERALFQLSLAVNKQNYISLVGDLSVNHVIPAGQLARALLEESIRWEWMTDDPAQRLITLERELRKNLKNIADECSRLDVDCSIFLNPSPFWTTENLKPFTGAPGFPSNTTMLDDIERQAKEAFEAEGLEYPLKIRHQLYVYYRILSQITHTSVLGMTATMQPGTDTDVTVAQSLPPPFIALILHVAAASVVNIARHTLPWYEHDQARPEDHLAWLLAASEMSGRLAEKASAIHGLAV